MKVAIAELVGGPLDGEQRAIPQAMPELRLLRGPASPVLWELPEPDTPLELAPPYVYRRRELEPDAAGLIHYDLEPQP